VDGLLPDRTRRPGDCTATVGRAAQLLGSAEAVREVIGMVLMPGAVPLIEHIVGATHAQLDAATFVAAWARGRAMPLEQVIEDALVADRPLQRSQN
jgi:uncharacterized protein (UPF0261 family)